MTGRLHYIDWLRVSAFAILIVYHCSVAFFPDMPWLLKSHDTSPTLSAIMDFPRAWRLALLFFVSGMGTWFAFRSNAGPGFLGERVVRLGVPLLFAMCVLIVPQVWYERMHEDGYTGSFLTFWVHRYFTEGRYPDGNFTWAHMWFVAYLLVMAVFCYPIFRILTDPRTRAVGEWFERIAASKAVYALFLLPLVLNLALSPLFPRQTNALYNDGAWFAVWCSWFGLGFLLGRHHHAVIAAIVEKRWLSAALALALTAALYRHAWLPADPAARIGGYDDMTPLFKTLLFALAWTMILALVGFAALHLNRKSRALTWLNHKIFPLYIIHQTVIVAALYYLLPLDLGLFPKLLLVMAVTVVVSLAFAVATDRLPWPFRLLVGLSGQSGVGEAAKGATLRR